MNYRERQPPDYLRGYVRYIWTLERTTADILPATFRPIADGCPGVMFHQSNEGALVQNQKQLPDLFLYGQTTQCTEISSIGTLRTIGVVFYPDALKTVFGLEADELTNGCTDLNLLSRRQGHSLAERLQNTQSVDSQISVLSSYLTAQLTQTSRPTDAAMKYALSQLIASSGNVSLKKLQDDLRLTERSFERRFKQWVGISPKLFARICRFQASLGQLRNNTYDKLSDIAFEQEYADQSHFIRTFKEFAGVSPYQFRKQTGDVADNFSLLMT
ncbi:AraC family transcriptional regulator [Spirosoma fluminis]